MVLCLFHQADAHLPKSNKNYLSLEKLKAKRKRSEENTKEIGNIVKNRKKSSDNPGSVTHPLFPGIKVGC